MSPRRSSRASLLAFYFLTRKVTVLKKTINAFAAVKRTQVAPPPLFLRLDMPGKSITQQRWRLLCFCGDLPKTITQQTMRDKFMEIVGTKNTTNFYLLHRRHNTTLHLLVRVAKPQSLHQHHTYVRSVDARNDYLRILLCPPPPLPPRPTITSLLPCLNSKHEATLLTQSTQQHFKRTTNPFVIASIVCMYVSSTAAGV